MNTIKRNDLPRLPLLLFQSLLVVLPGITATEEESMMLNFIRNK